MRRCLNVRNAFALCVAASFASGCGTPGSPALSSSAMLQNMASSPIGRGTRPGVTVHPAVSTQLAPPLRSAKAKDGSLLYLAGGSGVSIYTFPVIREYGSLDVYGFETYLCSDKAGNVWVAEWDNYYVVEYSHGGTKPIKTLTNAARYAMGCSVDPTTGNLAVANMIDQTGPPGNLFVYSPTGSVAGYASPKYEYYWSPGYDDRGNLFVEATTFDGKNQLVELPKGGSNLQTVHMSQAIHYPAGVQWDGTYLAVGDQMYQGRDVSGIYRVKVTGSRATVVGSLKLTGTCGASDILQFWISGAHIVGPDMNCNTEGIYRYPRGGEPIENLSDPYVTSGATISIAK